MIRLPHLETNITTACQLSCRDCNHFIPISSPTFVSVKNFEKDLTEFSRIAHTDAYALIGGEPLIHRDLISLLEIAQKSGISEIIEVWTNGLLIRRMPEAFWELTDRLVLSLYAGKTVDLPFIRERCRMYGTQLTIKDRQPFTHVLYKDRSEERAIEKYKNCWYRTFTHVLDNGFFYRCCTSPFIPKLILSEPEGTDGIPIKGLTEDGLRDFLDRKDPMRSCSVCGGHDGIRRIWKEVDRKKWIEESAI